MTTMRTIIKKYSILCGIVTAILVLCCLCIVPEGFAFGIWIGFLLWVGGLVAIGLGRLFIWLIEG